MDRVARLPFQPLAQSWLVFDLLATQTLHLVRSVVENSGLQVHQGILILVMKSQSHSAERKCTFAVHGWPFGLSRGHRWCNEGSSVYYYVLTHGALCEVRMNQYSLYALTVVTIRSRISTQSMIVLEERPKRSKRESHHDH